MGYQEQKESNAARADGISVLLCMILRVLCAKYQVKFVFRYTEWM